MRADLDGVYNRRAWNQEPDRWSYLGPFADNQERLVQQALTPMFMTAEEIGQYVEPVLPQVETFRPRFGYPPVQERQARVEDIVSLERTMPHPASSWYSGGPAGYQGGERFASNNLGLV